MEIFIVAIIVGLAAVFLIRRLLRSFRIEETNACDCGCSGCQQTTICEHSLQSDRDI